ncbi:MAG: hypothetical protein ACREKM_00245 [Longimicrobiales bacterium]
MFRSAVRMLALAGAVLIPVACDTAADDAEVPVDAAADSAPLSPAGAAVADALIDPDQATTDQLTAIPGIDGALAERIVAGRPYADMLALDAVLAESLDEAQRDEVYRHLWQPIDLNTASGEEIQLIPGVGDRMQHEFEEYRPYTAIEQFRREIGKYVDDAEVARLEQYVTIR